jgi:transcriptional regulator with XRE-family HTH domain
MNYERERLALGAELRRLRKNAGLTGTQLASRTGISQSKISKIETGLLLPTTADINQVAAAVNAPQRVSERLAEQLTFLQTEFSSWRIAHRYGFTAKQFDVAELEQKARIIRVFQLCVIPGLLQTPAYARSVMTLANVTNQGDIQSAIQARIYRQQLLYDSARHFEFIITEAAIVSRFCTREVVAQQIEHLYGMITLPTVRIGLVPMRQALPALPQNSFCVFDEEFATVETLTAEIQVSDVRDVQEYESLFRRIATVSLYGDEARSFLNDCQRRTCAEGQHNGTITDRPQ